MRHAMVEHLLHEEAEVWQAVKRFLLLSGWWVAGALLVAGVAGTFALMR